MSADKVRKKKSYIWINKTSWLLPLCLLTLPGTCSTDDRSHAQEALNIFTRLSNLTFWLQFFLFFFFFFVLNPSQKIKLLPNTGKLFYSLFFPVLFFRQDGTLVKANKYKKKKSLVRWQSLKKASNGGWQKPWGPHVAIPGQGLYKTWLSVSTHHPIHNRGVCSARQATRYNLGMCGSLLQWQGATYLYCWSSRWQLKQL